jgi:ACS family hexuronate transporter-like MFS transporter
MVALAFLATTLNYLDRQTLSVVAPVLREELHMSNVTYSRILFGFMLAYTLANGFCGPLMDRLGTRLGYALSMGWWSAATVLHAIATGPWSLGIYRFFLAIGEAGNWPAAVKLVAEWFPPAERAFASGIFNAGSAIGAVAAPPLVAWLLLSYGWPTAFVVSGVSGGAWLVLWLLLYRAPAAIKRESAAPSPPVGKLLRTRFVVSFTIAKACMDPVWYFYIFWFPTYLKDARGFDMAAIGRYAWIPFLAAAAGNLLGGWFAAALFRLRIPNTPARKLAVLFFALLMTSAIPAALVKSPWISMALISLAMLGYTGATANMLAFPADVFRRDWVGSVWGLAGIGSGGGGMVFALVTGWLVDHYSYTPVFAIAAVLPLVCAAIVWFWLGPLRPLDADFA